MRKICYVSHNMAWYLWRKWNLHLITEESLQRLLSDDAFCDLFGGWFADFHYDDLLEDYLCR